MWREVKQWKEKGNVGEGKKQIWREILKRKIFFCFFFEKRKTDAKKKYVKRIERMKRKKNKCEEKFWRERKFLVEKTDVKKNMWREKNYWREKNKYEEKYWRERNFLVEKTWRKKYVKKIERVKRTLNCWREKIYI